MVRRYALRMMTISRSAQALFIAITILVNVVVLGRSYLTMLVLNFGELGLVALLQSIILLIGTLQFGFHQGGYRLICSADADEAHRINNLVYSYTALIGIGALLVAVAMLPFTSLAMTQLFLILGALGGGMTLLRNWLNSQMIALGMLRQLNWVNLWSALGSLLPFAFLDSDPLIVCALSVLLQPAIGIVMAMVLYRDLRPTGINADRVLAKAIMASGFAMFLSSVFLQLNMQIERWYVLSFLGLDSLGHLYLAILFVTLFQIVPNSLSALYLPRIVKAHDRALEHDVRVSMRQFFLLSVGYCFLGAVALLTLGGPVVQLVLPQYFQDLRYVELLLPGLVAFTLANALAVVFNILIEYKVYLIAFGSGLLMTALTLSSTAVTRYRFDLVQVSLIKSAVYLMMTVILVFGYLAITRRHPAFRFSIVPKDSK